MAYGQLTVHRDSVPNGSGSHLVWMQGPCRYIRPIYGYWCHLWAYDRNHGESPVAVSLAELDSKQTSYAFTGHTLRRGYLRSASLMCHV